MLFWRCTAETQHPAVRTLAPGEGTPGTAPRHFLLDGDALTSTILHGLRIEGRYDHALSRSHRLTHREVGAVQHRGAELAVVLHEGDPLVVHVQQPFHIVVVVVMPRMAGRSRVPGRLPNDRCGQAEDQAERRAPLAEGPGNVYHLFHGTGIGVLGRCRFLVECIGPAACPVRGVLPGSMTKPDLGAQP